MLLARRLPRFNSRLDHLSDIIATIDASGNRTVEQIFAAEKALIQVQIEWEHFVRDLILDSATGLFSNRSGRVFSRTFSGLGSREAAAHRLVSTFPRRQFEPDWYLPLEAIDASIRLDISNIQQVSAELGVAPWPINDLRHMRNFIAHKSKRSALNFRGTGIVGASANIDVLGAAFQYAPSGSKRYVEWISFSKGVAARMAT